MDDEELARTWERAELGRAISHEEHVRIALTLLRRFGAENAATRILSATHRNCEALGAPEKFDASLTSRWTKRLAELAHAHPGESPQEVIRAHPELLDSRLLGLPAWRDAGGG